ncbi:5'(3')-deoxyribonucleotidase [Chitinophaga niastensis]|uniref:5'(3')-deoxyribonucleotidase n=1 Tax=Chitinophaga niastensis TaxID=536980 RepID=A0A2P8HA56_CHINA|nr:5'(3')-deoxyribonucleotidase [Chitinophaga niastensis]PSL43107.1 5'(3')-deoxyribonucleotidase [Chitinophaga niastensis]
MQLSIAIDMDETIADPIKKAREWYYRDFGKTFTTEELHGKSLTDILPAEHKLKIREYLNTPGFFRDIDVFPHAQEVLEELNKKYKLFIVSAAMEFPTSLKDKYDWLQDNFPFLSWKQFCFCGDKSIVQTDIMIDDLTRNFAHFKGKPYLYSGHHNIHAEGFERILDWQDAVAKLL